MVFFFISLVAGALTVLAPCILPLLPVVIGSSASGRNRSTPYVVVGSLSLSVLIFTYLLKVSTAFIMIPAQFWSYFSGVIIILFGLVLLFPRVWERAPGVAHLAARSNKLIGVGYQKHGFWGDVLVGAALGPVFSTCSPTYFVILASVLPVSRFLGAVYLLGYIIGLSMALLPIALLGERFASRLSGFANPESKLKKGLGIMFVVLGILIVTGYEKKLETAILDSGFFDVTKAEHYLLEQVDLPTSGPETESAPASTPEVLILTPEPLPTTVASTSPVVGQAPQITPMPAPEARADLPKYQEIVNPAGFVNTDGITVGELIGKKVVLVDFLTYSCINCQRTFPYLRTWYEKYKDRGLEIVGIHTPEFAFEKNIDNVRAAMEKFGIKYPIVLDNNYATWNAYGNRFWPRKYLIDIHGNVVYDHIGEGAYVETEMKIRELLDERARVLAEKIPTINEPLAALNVPLSVSQAQSQEIYFGSARRDPNSGLKLEGDWQSMPEYAEAAGANARIIFPYRAAKVFMVAEADEPAEVEVYRDGNLIQTITVKASQLYTLIDGAEAGEYTLELHVPAGVRLYTLTFG